MFCSKCGKQLKPGDRFCESCGAKVISVEAPKQSYVRQANGKAKAKTNAPKSRKTGVIFLAVAGILALAVIVVLVFRVQKQNEPVNAPDASGISKEQDTEIESNTMEETEKLECLARPQLLSFETPAEEMPIPSLTPYSVSADLSEVVNLDQFYLQDDEIDMLAENLFLVTDSYGSEFFHQYEENRYLMIPNFVTVDSMMHTYHLYFSLLLNRTEKNYLASKLHTLSDALLTQSVLQYEMLQASEWETAAARNVVFFAVAALLQDPDTAIPDYALDQVEREYTAIMSAEGISESAMLRSLVDYSQFTPRGYYEGDETLERYFRAMMWYGQINFAQKEEDMNRSALLITLAMHDTELKLWEEIYSVTSCFAGYSDDLGYYEYEPAIVKAYGTLPETAALIADNASFADFVETIGKLDAPQINSIPVMDPEGTVNLAEEGKGFRFMGQRFTLDAAVMQQLVYNSVKENSAGEKRMLPDTLDVAAALGSDTAMTLLEAQGEMDYEGYGEKLNALRSAVQNASSELWSGSLYASWLYTLEPLLCEKEEGWPSFMTSEAWSRKSLESFAGSFTELKHDTVLYAKQVMAEMGGGPPEEVDDRGYVEPEYEVYKRLMILSEQTANGLSMYGILTDVDRENLSRLEELARSLMEISKKELLGQTLSDDEYELIRNYGGTLEHLWYEAVKERSESEYCDSREIPASLVTDIATDPNGSVLQIANGRISKIYVIVPVDGTLRLATGMVFNFYQFEQPISNRLTDRTWRQMIGEWATDDGTWNWNAQIEKPWWTDSYRLN